MKPWMLKIFVVLSLVILEKIYTLNFYAEQGNLETEWAPRVREPNEWGGSGKSAIRKPQLPNYGNQGNP